LASPGGVVIVAITFDCGGRGDCGGGSRLTALCWTSSIIVSYTVNHALHSSSKGTDGRSRSIATARSATLRPAYMYATSGRCCVVCLSCFELGKLENIAG